MPVILDTDLMSILQRRSQPHYDRVSARLLLLPEDEVRTTIVSFQEQTKGWLAAVNSARDETSLLWAYEGLMSALLDYCHFKVLPFDRAAHDRFTDLKQHRLRIGTMDLRIASITLATGSTLLSRNQRDFRQVLGLVTEDWTQEQTSEGAP